MPSTINRSLRLRLAASHLPAGGQKKGFALRFREPRDVATWVITLGFGVTAVIIGYAIRYILGGQKA